MACGYPCELVQLLPDPAAGLYHALCYPTSSPRIWCRLQQTPSPSQRPAFHCPSAQVRYVAFKAFFRLNSSGVYVSYSISILCIVLTTVLEQEKNTCMTTALVWGVWPSLLLCGISVAHCMNLSLSSSWVITQCGDIRLEVTVPWMVPLGSVDRFRSFLDSEIAVCRSPGMNLPCKLEEVGESTLLCLILDMR